MTWLLQSRLRTLALLVVALVLLQSNSVAVSKPHVITFGKWITVPSSSNSLVSGEDEKPLALKVRPLLIDSRVKEFTFGPAHDVTDRLFVIRRAFRVNDSLPQESAAAPNWLWQRGGWLLVDRLTGHISAINLPDFDAFSSSAGWYRDYAACCGVSDDGKKNYAIVAQINRRKPVLMTLLQNEKSGESQKNDVQKIDDTRNPAFDSACAVPTWQRNPARVTFEPANLPKQTFAIRAHTADLIPDEPDDEEASK